MPSIPPRRILNVHDLAKEFSLDTQTARILMEREDFPSTKIECINGESAYVIDRQYLERWVSKHSRRVDEINCNFPIPKGFEDLISKNE